MPRKIQPLTDVQVRTAKPSIKAQRLFDGSGLYLEISPAGGKLWRLKYRIDGKEKLLSIGAYPTVGLKEARDRREDARKLVAQGIDPAAKKKPLNRQKPNSTPTVSKLWPANGSTNSGLTVL
jgi:Arm DNA-binding domain